VFDKASNLWIRDAATSRLIRVDTTNPALPASFVGPVMPCPYAITADRRGYVYAGGGNCVARLDPSAASPTWESLVLPNACFPRGLSLDYGYNLWVPDTCYGAFHVDASKPIGQGMTLVKAIPLSNPGPSNDSGYYLGSAIDGNGYPWIIGTQTDNLSGVGGPPGKVFRIDPANGYQTTSLAVGATPYVYSDLSGSQLALSAPTTGRYRKNFTAYCGADASWTAITYGATVPPQTTLEVRYRSGKDLASLDSAPFVSAGVEPPSLLQPIKIQLPPGSDPSIFQVEFVIVTADTANKPTLGAVTVGYRCPVK
jgi:hypothetical protein